MLKTLSQSHLYLIIVISLTCLTAITFWATKTVVFSSTDRSVSSANNFPVVTDEDKKDAISIRIRAIDNPETETSPSACTPAPANLVSWWTAEGNGNDSFGNGNGTLFNGTSFTVGKVSQAFSFDGIDDHVKLPSSYALNSANGVTLEAWIFPTSFGSYNTIISKWDSVDGLNRRSYALDLEQGGRVFFKVNRDGSHENFQTVTSSSSVPPNAWSHVAAVYDGSNLKVFINGELSGQLPYTNGIFVGNADISIGALAGGGPAGQSISNFAGGIDEPTIYNRGLSATEIQGIYNAGGSGKCVPANALSVSPASGVQSSTTFVANYSAASPNGSVRLVLTDATSGSQEISTVTASGLGQATAFYTTSCATLPGNYTLRMTDVATNSFSNAVPITITESFGCILAQTVSDISPTTVVTNTETTLTVRGTNFSPGFGAKVRVPNVGTFDIAPSGLTYVSPTEVRVKVTMGGNPTYDAFVVITQLRQSDVERRFTVVAPSSVPTISTVTSPIIKNQVQTLTIGGTGFQQNFKAFITSPDCVPSCELLSGNKHWTSAGQVEVNVLMQGTPPYSATVKIQNPDGQFATGSFQVIAQSQPPTTPLEVIGIEVTQAVQDLNNSVPLIQGKTTYVRVHVRSNTTDIPNVRAQLSGTRIVGAVRTALTPTLQPIERTVLRNPIRAHPIDSFLFTLPPTWISGVLELQFQGVNYNFAYNEADGNHDGKVQVTFETAPTLRIKLLSVSWQNGSEPPLQPSDSDLDAIEHDLRNIIPTTNITFSRTVLRVADRPSLSLDFFYNLDFQISHKRTSECGTTANGCTEYYLGVISPEGAPFIDGVSGLALGAPEEPTCNSTLRGNVAAGFYYPDNNRNRLVPVHEFGHLLGRFHTLNTGREQGVCLHIPSDGTIGGTAPYYSPGTVFGFDGTFAYISLSPDIMSYGDARWVSAYTYSRMLDHIRSRFGSLRSNQTPERLLVHQGENTILIGGSINNGTVAGELSASYQLPSPIDIPPNGVGSYSISFFDGSGQEIDSFPFNPDYSDGNNRGNFSILLPQQSSASRISLLKNGQVLASKNKSMNAPSVTVIFPNGGEMLNTPTVNFQWTANDADGDSLRYLLQYSSDSGATWATITSDLAATNYQVSLDTLSGTSQGLFRVIASDGFNSSLDQSNSVFSVNPHAPHASINAPLNNSYFVGDQNIVLSGGAFDLEDGQLADPSLVWSSNLEGSLGSGQNLSINAGSLQEGTHVITLTARDSSAQTGTATVTIRVYQTQPPIPATLSAAPSNLSFIAQQGTSNLSPPQTLAVRNEGDGIIHWTAAANQPWVHLGTTTGTAPSNPDVTIDPTGLALGNYSETITITTSDASNSPQTVNVSLAIVSYSIPGSRTQFDYDGDGKSDVSVYRPTNGLWYVDRSQAGGFVIQLGNATDRIAPADYDGDGKTDVAVYRQASGTWYLYNSATSTYTTTGFGIAEDLPAPGDYDGDGKADLAVYRPSTGTWWLNRSSAGLIAIQFGLTGDVPVPGDFDGDGKADLVVYRPSNGVWYMQRSTAGGYAIQFGNSTDKIVPADYDGDGKMDVAIYRPSQGTWYSVNSSNGGYPVQVFGLSTDIPVPGDYDGDGKADVAIFRPSNGQWWLNRTTSGLTVTQFGSNGDKPTESAFGN